MVKKEIKEIIDLDGCGPATVEKLNTAGYFDLLSIAVAAPGMLAEAAGVSEAVARKMINSSRNNLNIGFESGVELVERREKVFRVSTGVKDFDELLGGGIESGSITEAYGAMGSGKSQLAHIAAVQCVKQFPDSKVIFIDTEKTFRPERIKQLAEALDLDAEKVMNQITVGIAYSSDHQMLLAEKALEMLSQKEDIKMIIVDSLTAHFRVEYLGRGNLAPRQQKINRHMHVLAKAANSYDCVVYVTNQMMSKPDGFGLSEVPIGGNIIGHNSTTRLWLARRSKNERHIKLIDSPHLADGEVKVEVCENGFKSK